MADQRSSEQESPIKSIPANIEAERAVLGSLLIDPDAIIKVANFLRPEDFFRERHSWLYESMLALNERREPLDFVTLVDELERREQLEEVGGPAYITELVSSTPTAIYIDHYARIVERTALLRRLIAAAGTIAELAYDESQDMDQVLERAEQIIFGISESRVHRDLTPIESVMQNVVNRLDFLSRNQDTLMGVSTGFHTLDAVLGGFQQSDLIILAARPGMGKCVTADTRLVNPDTGAFSTIDELVQRRCPRVFTVDERLKLQATHASDFIDDGVRPVYAVRTASGREIKTTLSHPFLTTGGWRPLAELQTGEYVAVPRILPVFGTLDVSDDEVKIVADSLSNGFIARRSEKLRNHHVRLRRDVDHASKKDIPSTVFQYTRTKLARFLHHLFASDGRIILSSDRKKAVCYRTVSKPLAHSIQHLLLRFGIIAKQSVCQIRYQGQKRLVYEVRITDAESVHGFAKEIGSLGQAATIARQAEMRSVAAIGDSPQSVEHFAAQSPPLTSPSPVASYQTKNDVYWDRIVSIEYRGKQQVYDLTIPQTHNFLANDIIVHNTSFTLSVVQKAAQNLNSRIGIFSLEMSAEQLVQRLLSMETRIDSHRLRMGQVYEGEWTILLEVANNLSNTSIFIDDTPGVSVNELRTKARRLYAEHGMDLLIIDYMQLMSGQGAGRSENRQQEISYISRSLKGLARELNIPVLACSQLSRAVEGRADKRPMLSDLRESGSIEQDADVVMFLYREDYYIEDTDRQNIADVIIAKHRHGSTGTVSLYFRPELTQFSDIEIQRTDLDY